MFNYSIANYEVFPVNVPTNSELKSINFFLVKFKDSLTLIDAGFNNEACWNALLDTLKHNNFQLQDITEIILTHHHIDHVGLVDKIASMHPIPVYASPLSIPRLKRDREYLERRVEFFENLYKEMDCGKVGEKQVAKLKKAIENNKDQAIQSDINEILEHQLLHFNVIEVPGHAQDHIALWNEQNRSLFSGDVLLEHISSNAFIEPDDNGKRIFTLVQQRDSLFKCACLNANQIFSGHGKIIDNPNQLIKKRLARIEDKSNHLLRLIESGITTANELAISFYKKTYYNQFSLVMSEIISYLDYLEYKENIKKDSIKGIWHYYVTSPLTK